MLPADADCKYVKMLVVDVTSEAVDASGPGESDASRSNCAVVLANRHQVPLRFQPSWSLQRLPGQLSF